MISSKRAHSKWHSMGAYIKGWQVFVVISVFTLSAAAQTVGQQGHIATGTGGNNANKPVAPNDASDNKRVQQNNRAAAEQTKKDALVLYQSGEYAASIEQCEREIASDPSRVDAYVIMCWGLVKSKRYAEAQKRAIDGLKISPYDLRLIEIYGESKYYLGDNNGALEQFQKYAARSTENGARLGAAYYFMGEIYVRQSRFQHADIAMSTAVKKEPLMDRWWGRLGYAREMAGNYREAISAYDEALRLNSALTDATNGRARVAARLQ